MNSRHTTILRIAIAVLLLAAPLAEAQQTEKVYRIGLLGLSSHSDVTGLAALRQGLRDLGYEEGRNLVIEYRWAEGRYDHLPALADELVRLKVDVLVTYGTPGARAAQRATATIPVVVASMGDAVAMGIVPNLARPGGNITGSQSHFPEVMGKRIEMLKEAIPRLARVAVLFNPANPSLPPALKVMEVIWQPIGAEADATWLIDNSGQEATYCCLNAVLRDYARFGLLLAHDGNWRGRQIIPAAWLLDATAVQADRPHMSPDLVRADESYGYQTWILPGEHRTFMVNLAVHKMGFELFPLQEMTALWTALVRQRGGDHP